MILKRAEEKALALLASLPSQYPEAEMSISGIDDYDIWLGVGYLVGKGFAVYRGSFCFRLTDSGKALAITLQHGESK